MQVQKSYHNASTTGELYLVPTPIGNFQDMTFRAVEVLQTVDFVCAEDTRNTGILLKHFDIPVKQISFHEHNAYDKIPELIALLKDGKRLAQVSDAGMPSISDPGHDLVKAAIEEGIPVISLPGASAGITALIASGLVPQPHVFYGFLPRKAGQQKGRGHCHSGGRRFLYRNDYCGVPGYAVPQRHAADPAASSAAACL